MIASDIVKNLLELQTKYATTYRAIVTEEKYKGVIESGLLKNFEYDNLLIRESLIEHVGHLPIIAAYLHQFIEKKDEVDLGKALTMLAIHDIGETETGDIITYSKTKKKEELELKNTRLLLTSELMIYFDEFEKNVTMSAKYAKAIDSLAPFLHEIIIPKVTIKRFKFWGFDSAKIAEKKRKYFEWDSVLIEIFDYIISEYEKMEAERS